jgi:hypothetical protein
LELAQEFRDLVGRIVTLEVTEGAAAFAIVVTVVGTVIARAAIRIVGTVVAAVSASAGPRAVVTVVTAIFAGTSFIARQG